MLYAHQFAVVQSDQYTKQYLLKSDQYNSYMIINIDAYALHFNII